MRDIYIEFHQFRYSANGDYDLMYTPWRVKSFYTLEQANEFLIELKSRLNKTPFNDWDIGHVLNIRDSIIKNRHNK